MSEVLPDSAARRRVPSVIQRFLLRRDTSNLDDSSAGDSVHGNSIHGYQGVGISQPRNDSYHGTQGDVPSHPRSWQGDRATGAVVSHTSNRSQEMEDFMKRTESMLSADASKFRNRRSSIRYRLLRIVRHKAFATFIYICIGYNTITIAMNDFQVDRDNGSQLNAIIDASDWVVLGIFTGEMVMKMLAMGLGYRSASGRDSKTKDDESLPSLTGDDNEDDGYFVSYWNRMDCFIVIVSWLLIIIRKCYVFV
jgi:hypothetical protein